MQDYRQIQINFSEDTWHAPKPRSKRVRIDKGLWLRSRSFLTNQIVESVAGPVEKMLDSLMLQDDVYGICLENFDSFLCKILGEHYDGIQLIKIRFQFELNKKGLNRDETAEMVREFEKIEYLIFNSESVSEFTDEMYEAAIQLSFTAPWIITSIAMALEFRRQILMRLGR